ncbi:MAG: S8 family serine peptidase [Muribaculaceae bacterium]|nr:S8 family serine peptidase [Muribaculaceae bacterium]
MKKRTTIYGRRTMMAALIAMIGYGAASAANGADGDAGEAGDDAQERVFTGAVVRIDAADEDATIAKLEEEGGFVLNHRDDLWLICWPVDSAVEVSGSRGLFGEESGAASSSPDGGGDDAVRDGRKAPNAGRRVRGSRGMMPRRMPAKPALDVARGYFNADYIQAGTGLPQPFDGSGVVVGICDIGFDASHATFGGATDNDASASRKEGRGRPSSRLAARSDQSDGSDLVEGGPASRVKRMVIYSTAEGSRVDLTEPAAIAARRTDTPDQTHATHVAGILAGNGGGDAYVGLAPGAEIVATTSDLYDVALLAGAEDIIEYAKSVGMPAVINMSVGSYNGPHDGSSLFCQYVDKCADDAIICLSAGNEGETLGHIGYTFAGDESLLYRLYDEFWAYRDIRGQIEAWSIDNRPLRASITVHDTKAGGMPVIFETPAIDFTEEPTYVLTSDPELAAADPACHYFEEYAALFDGNIVLQGGVNEENGRYCVTLYADTHTDILVSDTDTWGRYQIGGRVWGEAGQAVDLFADCQYSRFKTTGVTVKPDTDFSLSDLATASRAIAVGAYWGRESAPLGEGNALSGQPEQRVCAFSSYATLNDGRRLPLTVAPGGFIVSAFNGAYTEAHPNVATAGTTADGSPWGLDSGTSMSSPYVAGAIATWLQADPTLTSEDVKEIILSTNRTADYPYEANPRHGCGYFDPYAGLLKVVERGYTGIPVAGAVPLGVSYADGVLRILSTGGHDVAVELYAADGRLLRRLEAPAAPCVELSLDGVPSGIAIARIASGDAVATRKLALR